MDSPEARSPWAAGWAAHRGVHHEPEGAACVTVPSGGISICSRPVRGRVLRSCLPRGNLQNLQNPFPQPGPSVAEEPAKPAKPLTGLPALQADPPACPWLTVVQTASPFRKRYPKPRGILTAVRDLETPDPVLPWPATTAQTRTNSGSRQNGIPGVWLTCRGSASVPLTCTRRGGTRTKPAPSPRRATRASLGQGGCRGFLVPRHVPDGVAVELRRESASCWRMYTSAKGGRPVKGLASPHLDNLKRCAATLRFTSRGVGGGPDQATGEAEG